MENKPVLVQELEKKYMKTYEITDFKDLLYKTYEKNKEKVAFKIKEDGKIKEITYKKYKEDVENLATELLELGLENQKICVIGKNSYKWAVSYLATAIIGIVVPLDKELNIDEIINFINISESCAILGDNKYIGKLIENKENINKNKFTFIDFDSKEDSEKIYSFDKIIEKGKKLIENGDERFKLIKINPNDMHILLFTSGTTGSSKAVMLSHKNICSNIMSVSGTVSLKFGVRVLSILPIHHTYECTLGYLLVIYAGGCVAFCDGLRHIAENMKEYKPNLILCVPLLLESVYKKIIKTLQKSLPEKYLKKGKNVIESLPIFLRPIVKGKIKKTLGGKLKTFIVGAAAMNPDISAVFESIGIRVLQGYGLTECSPLVAGNNDFYRRNDSVGLPIPNVEYKIADPNSEGVGEIIVKGPNVMLGYYKNEEATKAVMKNGWFYTGDLGRIDENGYLFITGRSKSVIIAKNGKNIYPEELEHYLNEEPVILESIVVGVKDDKKGDTFVKAKIFPNIDAIKEFLKVDIPTKEQIKQVIANAIQAVNKKIPNYKHIRGFKIVDKELEKTTTQKIKRYGENTKIDEDENVEK